MPDGVHPLVEAVQVTCAYPALHGVRREPARTKLVEIEDAPLVRSEPSDLHIGPSGI